MECEPLELLLALRSFVRMQVKLLSTLRDRLGARDWRLLIDVPRNGQIDCDGELWQYSVHGTGIRFQKADCSIDANRGLDCFPEAFDAGRIVEYVHSQGADQVRWRGKTYEFGYDEAPSLFRELADVGDILMVNGADCELYMMPT